MGRGLSAKRTHVAILATLDTKRNEAAFLADQLSNRGVSALMIDVGREPTVLMGALRPDVSDKEMGDGPAEFLRMMAPAASALLSSLASDGKIAGAIGLGGGKGSYLCAEALRALPFGMPKVLVSTSAIRASLELVGTSDLQIIPSPADLIGINRVTGPVLRNAAAALGGMVTAEIPAQDRRSAVAATAFGVTSPAATAAAGLLTSSGYEPIVFHANGIGGAAMEDFIERGLFAAVLDLTVTELADELCGGTASAGKNRLTAAGRAGLPQVIAPGAIDMVNFHGLSGIPHRYRKRRIFEHSPIVALVRTSPTENRKLGEIVATRLQMATGPWRLLIPQRGFSAYDRLGESFYDPKCTKAFEAGVDAVLGAGHPSVVRLNLHINEAQFARTAVAELLTLLRA